MNIEQARNKLIALTCSTPSGDMEDIERRMDAVNEIVEILVEEKESPAL